MNLTEEQLKTLSDYFDGQSDLPLNVMEVYKNLRAHFDEPIVVEETPVEEEVTS